MAKIKGREALRRFMKKMPQELRKQVRAAILEGAESMADTMRSLAPVRTGKLRKSIKVTPADQNPPAYASLRSKRVDGDLGLAAIITAGNTDVRTAHLVEFGSAPHKAGGIFEGAEHPGAAAQPFFFPGFRARKKDVQLKINRAAKKAIKDTL